MSKVIDERVVSMQFDNKHFESNVQTTLSTLDKLKAKLKFTDAGKGLESLSASAAKCNLNPLSNAVDTVGLRFNAMYTIADQALRNITNSAMAAGKKIVSALTIDPVKTGLSEYETKINSVQVIKANTRGKFDTEEEQMDAIYSALDKLNDYADRTIYNYTQMTDNVGKFVAQTGDIDKSVKAVEGLANLAGASGASASDMARATYQMSQALGGTIRKIDWNSLRSANMAGLELKNMLTDLAKVKGIDIDSMIKNKGTFEDTLEEGWLTGDLFLEAMNIYSDAYSEAELAAMGFNQEQIKNFKDLAATARQATTEVKTITQMWDVLKETAQSGWTKTWELIIGDFDSAKALLSPLSEFFMSFLNGMSDARNNLLEGALYFPKMWKSISDKLGGGLDAVKKVTDSIGDMIDKVEYFQNVVSDVWSGKYGIVDTGRFELLEAAGYDHRVVQDLVNLGHDYEITVEDIEASHKKFGITLTENAETTKKNVETLGRLSDAQLRNAGLTDAEIKVYRDLEVEAQRTGKSINELAEEMSKVDGRTLLIDSLKNAGKGLVTVFKSLGEAWKEIFPPMSIVRLYNIIKSINEFSRKLIVSGDTADKLTRIFKGLFAVIDIIGTVLGGAFRLAFKAVSGVLGLFNMDILDALAYLGDMLVKVRDWIDEHSLLNKVLDKFGPKIKEAVGFVKDWIDETKPMTKILETVSTFFEKSIDSISDWIGGFKNTDDIFGYLLEGLKSLPRKIFEGVKNVGVTLSKYLGKIFERPLDTVSAFKDNLLNKLGPVGDAIGKFVQKVKDFITDLDIGFGEIITILVGGGMIVALIKFASTFGKVVGILTNISDAFAGIGESISGAFDRIGKTTQLIGLAIAIAILAKAFIELAKLEWDQFAVGIASLASIAAVLGLLTFALGLMGKKSLEITTGAGVLIGIAAAIGILAYALHMVSKLESDNIVADILTLGGIGVALAATTVILSKLAPQISKGSFTMIAIAGAILLLVYAVSKIEALSITDPEKVILTFAGLITGLALVSRLANGMNFWSSVGILVIVGAILLFAHTLERLADINFAKIKANIGEIALIFAMLAAVLLVSRVAGSNAAKAGFGLLAISAALILVGVAIRTLASISPSDMAKGTDTITQILAIFALLTVVSMFAGSNAAKAGLMLMEMSVALMIIAGSIFVLSKVAQNNESGFQAATKCIMELMGMFALIILASSVAKSAMGTIITIGIVLGLLTVAIGALSMIPKDTLTTATGCLAGIMAMLAVLIGVTAFINTKGAAFLKTSATLIVMAGVVYVLGMVIKQIAGLEPQNALAATQSLSTLLLSLSAAMAIVSVAGMTGWAGLAGIGLFVAFIAAVGGLMWAIQALVSDAEAASAGLDVAIMVLEKIGTGIGSFVGGLIGGIGAGAFSGLQSMAEDLNAFMNALTKEGGFIEGAKSVDESAIEGVKNIIKLLAMFYGMEFLDTMQWVTSPFAKLKETFSEEDTNEVSALVTKLTDLGNAIKAFSDSTADLGEEDIERIHILSDAAKALVNVADSIPNEGGWLGAIVGENDMSTFGVKLASFGTSLVTFAQSISELTEDDVEKIKTSADAAMALTAMAESIPNMGGLLADCLGENDLSIFGEKLASFGGSLVAYAESIRGLTEEDIELIEVSADAGIALAEMASAVPNMGGLLADFFGENDLSVFGEELVLFGGTLVGYAESIRGLTDEDIELINLSADAGVALANMAESVPNMGGLLADIFGENSLANFATDLEGFGSSLLAYAESVSGLDDNHIEYINKSGEAVEALGKVAKKVPNEGGWWGAIAGENDLSGFSIGINDLGKCIKNYAYIAAGINDETIETIENSGNAVEALGDVAKKVPVLDEDINITGFTRYMPLLGDCISKYARTVADVDDDTVDVIKNSRDAVDELAKVAKKVPVLDGDVNISSFASAMPTLGGAVNKYVTNIGSISDEDVASAKRSAKILDAIKDAVKKLPGTVKQLSTSNVDAAISNIKKIIGFASEVGDVNTTGLSSLSDKLKNVASDGVKTFVQTFKNSHSDVNAAGRDLIMQFATGIADSTSVVTAIVTTMVNSVISSISTGSTSIYGAGANVAQSFASGISDYSYIAINKANALAASVTSIVKNALKINSPSKVFMEIGRSIPEGFAMGISDFGRNIVKSATTMSDLAVNGTSKAISRITEAINADIDTQPTIRPVLDLSDVKSGASNINSLFGMQPSLELLTNVGSISTTMNNRQNEAGASNDDVVAAIKDLKTAISESSGDTYSINGVTYDDGSNIAKALNSIIREIRLQERSR